MESDKKHKGFQKPVVDEDYLMNIMSGDEAVNNDKSTSQSIEAKENKPKEKIRASTLKKRNYEEVFLTNRYPSGRSGKVVYIRPEYHERLLRIVQLTREEKTTLYSYIDNILEQHFNDFGTEIQEFFNERNKPIF
ncbi:DUF3408 domain-containing protein [Flavobacterium muglaense]|uniref:DUF3408 domain-containing protein n=1 Tax=Flavobacterium muglaense TaxID=2764716 RepID=A0A923N1I5_9FLAO|nr:DUF3408 domain-containing protein [Flavobacterium muglaense]MBC5837842.1 DUF3408 domain-containing protein [Flavobacterium muglaense]MBC5844400.1 DUF3408 domain-containing protein [Flavobacterium muglaense]